MKAAAAWTCGECGAQFRLMSLLRRHLATRPRQAAPDYIREGAHSYGGEFILCPCGLAFSSAWRALVHLRGGCGAKE